MGPGRKVARIVAAASSSPQTELTSAFLLSVTHCLAIYVLLCTRDTHCLAIKRNDSHMRSVPESTTFSYPVFRIRFFFVRKRIEIFFLSPDPDQPKIRIRSEKIRIRIHEKNILKLLSTRRTNLQFIFSTLNTVLFGQVT